jgi:phospholipase/carboxylesterase
MSLRMTRAWGAVATAVAALGCWASGPVGAAQQGRLEARPPGVTGTAAPEPGERRLGLNEGRDATLYVPRSAASDGAMPLMVMLHGAGGSARSVSFMFPPAEELGVVILAPESRAITWDGVGGEFGPDVKFIDRALRDTFQHVRIDKSRLAIGGFSDGASYALSLGIANGDLFTHVIAFSPGFITPAPPAGRPAVFISHGTQDQVLPIDVTSRRIVPQLRDAGHRVTFREFDGPHRVPEAIAREALEWLTR